MSHEKDARTCHAVKNVPSCVMLSGSEASEATTDVMVSTDASLPLSMT